MPDDKPVLKWYFKTSILITALFGVGALALPLLWFNPRYSNKAKIIISLVVLILTYCLGIMFVNSIKTIGTYYQQLNQISF